MQLRLVAQLRGVIRRDKDANVFVSYCPRLIFSRRGSPTIRPSKPLEAPVPTRASEGNWTKHYGMQGLASLVAQVLCRSSLSTKPGVDSD